MDWQEQDFIAQKEKMIISFEKRFPPKASVEEILATEPFIYSRWHQWLVQLGEELCTHQPSMADPSHFERWQTVTDHIRDVYLRDQGTVIVSMNWMELTAWYLRSVDIALRKKGRPALDNNKSYLGVIW